MKTAKMFIPSEKLKGEIEAKKLKEAIFSDNPQHTPIPWKVNKRPATSLFTGKKDFTYQIETDKGNSIALLGMNQEANACFIVSATSAYEPMIEILKIFAKRSYGTCPWCYEGFPTHEDHKDECPIVLARQAIAKAEGKGE